MCKENTNSAMQDTLTMAAMLDSIMQPRWHLSILGEEKNYIVKIFSTFILVDLKMFNKEIFACFDQYLTFLHFNS